MIDTLPSRRSAIFTDTAVRKLPRSFYWGAGVALLVHAGLIYYLVQQNFAHTLIDEPGDQSKPIIITVDPPKPPPSPAKPQKPVSHTVIHPPLDPVTKNDPIPATPGTMTTTGTVGPPITLEPPATGGTGTGTGISDTPAAPVVPHWKAFPDAATLTDFYPARALDNEMEGSASVQCTVLDAAGHVHCALVAETPKGYGFGQQTVKMVQEKGRVDMSDGNIKIGSVLAVTTVKWQLN